MNVEKNMILFTLVYEHETYQVQTRPGAYYTLMTLISDRLGIPGFGLCSGMGSCGTCRVSICEKRSPIQQSMLSCGVPMDDELSGTTITIPAAVY
ncbi:MAG: 2Fe-2S iron-sulfur cluster binding domain-containing protein [Williamsia sp.]|nr:2Fe-2S iron-sulfur cluster binding domain-containing protein [Williamsia sp.]